MFTQTGHVFSVSLKHFHFCLVFLCVLKFQSMYINSKPLEIVHFMIWCNSCLFVGRDEILKTIIIETWEYIITRILFTRQLALAINNYTGTSCRQALVEFIIEDNGGCALHNYLNIFKYRLYSVLCVNEWRGRLDRGAV
jgi:hypothetical protein